MSIQNAVKKYCIGCSDGKQKVISCDMYDCPLWKYRTDIKPEKKAKK